MLHQLVNKPFCNSRSAFTSSFFHRLFFSTSLPPPQSENPPIETPFAVQYLVESCGLPKEKALKVSKHISHLKSPAKPDSVLDFLRQIGLDDADIRKAITNNPRIICAGLEKTIKPRILKIQEIGFSPAQVTRLIPLMTSIFRSNSSSLQERIKFWMPFLGSLEGIVRCVKRNPFLLNVSVEKVVEPNISFLQENCGLSLSQVKKMVSLAPTPFTLIPNTFVARIKNLKNLGFSKEEIGSMIMKQPMLLTNSPERVRIAVDFLTGEAGLDMSYIAGHPVLISLSLEKRIIPRNYVVKCLESKGLCKMRSFWYVMHLTEEQFAEKFVRPYKDIIPDVFEAYEAARAGKISLKSKTLQDNECSRNEELS